MSAEYLALNGLNGATGSYLMPDLTPEDIRKLALDEEIDPQHLKELQARYQQASTAYLGVKAGVDPKNIDETGWGVIFASEDEKQVPALKEALSELLALRQEQAGEYYKEYTGVDAYRPNELKGKFLARHHAGPGPADPEKVPYYLLIVGSPEKIPYRIQYQLDVQYAVGRIHFDTLAEYSNYARSVVAAEQGQVSLPREAVFFGVQNPDDLSTTLSASGLVEPLADKMAVDQADWQIETLLLENTYKANLAKYLGDDQPPALLFTASHGMGFPAGNSRQLPHQGALLCQDWPGPEVWKKEIPDTHYFSADDVGKDANIHGLIAFFFACYGAGTPLKDDFAHMLFKQPMEIAEQPFVARLPQRLLGHPKGGPLAIVGHVERVWSYSFQWEKAGMQLVVFEDMLKKLMEGHPVGYAVESFNERYAELASDLNSELEDIKFGKVPDDFELARMWTANNDARSYVTLGDPAVRIQAKGSSG